MDGTINTSPRHTSRNVPSAKIPAILNIVLAAAVGLWLMAIVTDTAMAQSHPRTIESSENVAYADLDLTTASGARTLLHRIDLAAMRICGPPSHSPLEPRAAALNRRCVIEAVDTAVAQIDAPVVAAALASEFPVSAPLASR